MKSIFKLSALSAAFLMGSAFAGGPEVPMNQTGLFVGAGGSYNSVKEVTNLSTTNSAGDVGPGTTFDDTAVTFAPYVQLGYFGQLSDSLLLGFKSWYKYLDADKTLGGLTTTSGHTLVEVPHEFSMMLMLGYMFTNSFIYLGGGSIFFDGIVTAQNDTKNGTTDEVNQIMWGGAAQIGWGYYLSPTWFLDLAYTYAISANYDFTRSIENSSGVATGSYVNADATQIRAQEFVASINKVFAL